MKVAKRSAPTSSVQRRCRGRGGEDGIDHLVRAPRQMNQPAFGAGGGTALEISEHFQLTNEIVRRLSRHADLPGEL